jgi:folate-binding protein YgfZ
MNETTALRLAGRDALGLLHRISTNDLADLTPGQVRATLFCDFRGRLLHRAVVGVGSDGALWLFRDDAPGVELAAFLDRHVFRDDVRIEDRSHELPVAVATAEPAPAPGAMTERGGIPTAVRAPDDEALTLGAGAAAGDDETRRHQRILAGRPGHGHEIVETFTPFEVGLAHEVHLDKGCYTGQETLMRLVTYKSVRRRLARVAGLGALPEAPADLTAEGRPAGILTSAAREGVGWIGLAVILNELCEAGHPLEIAGGGRTEPPEVLPKRRPMGRG